MRIKINDSGDFHPFYDYKEILGNCYLVARTTLKLVWIAVILEKGHPKARLKSPYFR